METSHFQKFVTEFPFLTRVLDLSYQGRENPVVYQIQVGRMSLETMKMDIGDDGRAIRGDGPYRSGWYDSVFCNQLFAVKSNGMVGELTGARSGWSHDEFWDNGNGTFDRLDPDYGLSDFWEGIYGPYSVHWKVLHRLNGDEKFLVVVEWQCDYDSGRDQHHYSRTIKILKAPKRGSLTKNLQRWQAVEDREAEKAEYRYYIRKYGTPA